jgi:hypothetical protein
VRLVQTWSPCFLTGILHAAVRADSRRARVRADFFDYRCRATLFSLRITCRHQVRREGSLRVLYQKTSLRLNYFLKCKTCQPVPSFQQKELDMLRKLLFTALIAAPLLASADPGNGNAYGHTKHAPEIDGSNVILGIALLGGIISLSRKRNDNK